jgi:hypothetical protein
MRKRKNEKEEEEEEDKKKRRRYDYNIFDCYVSVKEQCIFPPKQIKFRHIWSGITIWQLLEDVSIAFG